MQQLILLLAFSIAALLLGAGLGFLAQSNGRGLAALKGMMASFVGALVIFHLLPRAFSEMGALSLLFMVLGFALIVLVERVSAHGDESKAPRFFTAEILWLGLIVHQLADGMGLAVAAHEQVADKALAVAIIAHRIPVAAVVMWLYIQQKQPRKAWLRIGAMGLATLAGAFFYQSLTPMMSSGFSLACYAFISGSFLHLITHNFLDFHAHRIQDKRFEFVGFFLGLIFFVVGMGYLPGMEGVHVDFAGTAGGHDHGGAGSTAFIGSFLTLVKETAPFLLLGLIASGFVHLFMPASPIAWMQRGGPVLQSAKGMLFGLPLPICSCGVLPLFLSLAKKGLPPAALIAFLIATPELGIDSFLLSVKLLGVKFSLVRLVVAMVLPLSIALLAVYLLKPKVVVSEDAPKSCCKNKAEHPPNQPSSKWREWYRFAFVDLVDDIFPLVFFGLTVAAVAQSVWPTSRLGELVGQWDVLMLGALGIPFYVCASASVPFALVLLQHGFSIGAVVVFLFAGPATNVATILTVNKVFGKGSGLKMASIALAAAVLLGLVINGVYDPGMLDILDMHHHTWGLVDYFTVSAVSLLGLMSMWRAGPLHWLSELASIIPGVIHHPNKEADLSAS